MARDQENPTAGNLENGEDPSEALAAFRVAEARKAHERGWALMPLDGKIPRRKGWSKAPPPPLETALAWAEAGNIGLRTGSVSGVIVIDDDTNDGSGAAGLRLPQTVIVVTGSDKRHFYFRCPEDGLTNSSGNLPAKLDVRGDGGQVVYPGSVHPETGKPYRWLEGHSPEDMQVAELPEHIVALIRVPKSKKERTKPPKQREAVALDQGAQRALDRAAETVASASEGTRNDTLNCEAFRIARWVASGLLNEAEVERRLVQAAVEGGLPEVEARRTVQSGLSAGANQPLRLLQGDAATTASAGPTKSSIVIEGGALPKIVQQAEAALLRADEPLYQRGSQVVRVLRAPQTTMRDRYRRAEGILMIGVVDCPYLVERLTSVANWFAFAKEELVAIDCPERVARTYLARAGHWKLRSLLGVIETPTLRPDWSLLHKPGYDAATGLYLDVGAVHYPAIPDKPSIDDARRALAVIQFVLKDFPWIAECDRSAAIAAILTALIRPSLRTAPLFAFRAPKMASGKSLLADVVAMTATGRVASVMSQGKDEDEDKKRMLAILMEGIAVACIDNIERDFGGAALCSVLTQESYRDRLLGKSNTATVPTATTWLATGNNIRFVGDIVTRVVVIDLDAGVEKPEERKFDLNLYEYVPAHRAELVSASLTILRAYYVAGRPPQGLSVFGRFEDWSDWVRSALVWLDLADPCLGRSRLHQYDPIAALLRAVLIAWERALGNAAFTAAEVLARASAGQSGARTDLHDALASVASGEGGKLDARKLGNYLAKYERRLEAGLRIERVGDRQGMALWRVHRVGAPLGGAE